MYTHNIASQSFLKDCLPNNACFMLVYEWVLGSRVYFCAHSVCIWLQLYGIWMHLQGLIVSHRKESLQHFKKPWAHEHEACTTLLDAVKVCRNDLVFYISIGTVFSSIWSFFLVVLKYKLVLVFCLIYDLCFNFVLL